MIRIPTSTTTALILIRLKLLLLLVIHEVIRLTRFIITAIVLLYILQSLLVFDHDIGLFRGCLLCYVWYCSLKNQVYFLWRFTGLIWLLWVRSLVYILLRFIQPWIIQDISSWRSSISINSEDFLKQIDSFRWKWRLDFRWQLIVSPHDFLIELLICRSSVRKTAREQSEEKDT